MNSWNLSLIKTIINIKKIYNIPEDVIFDYLRIVDLNKVKYEKKVNNTLFFMTYSTKDDINNKFIIRPFDYRKKANDIIKNNPNFYFVLDEETYNNLDLDNKNAKIIVVDNILESVDILYNYTLKTKAAKIIGVTGSVGKTTSAGLIENVLKTKYKVLRIYSKRITPIILKANIINFLTKEIEYIVLEMSIYKKDHVEILSDLLKPDIAALIGIDSSHLEFFNSIDDICKYKSSIFRYAEKGYVNNLDCLVKNLNIRQNQLYYQDENIYSVKLDKLTPIAVNYIWKDDKLIIDNKQIKLFFNSELSIIQTLLAYNIGIDNNIDIQSVVDAISSYVPVENRIQKKNAFGKEIVFDGDITTNERIKQLSRHNYEKSYLVIRKFGSAENNKRFEKVLKSLDNFTKVYVFNDIEYLNMLSSHKNVKIVYNHNFMKDLDGKIIYHYSGYYRSFKEYNENNLIELENEIYPIMKPEEK